MISVIIPVYNHANRLEKSLLSLANQEYNDFEVVIVNDGSTDNFKEVYNRIISNPKISKLKIELINQENKGAPAARNAGFEKSKGEYVIFWDADTIGKPSMLKLMLENLEKNLSPSYAYSQFKFGWKTMKSGIFSAERLKESNFIDTTSLMRRSSFVPFDEALLRFQDWDMWLTMLEQNKTGIFIPEVLYTKQVFGRNGMSKWLPKIFYKLPFRRYYREIVDYETSREIILAKHDPKTPK
jgi:glycosyltransferase involved in cell wall biosynthesis